MLSTHYIQQRNEIPSKWPYNTGTTIFLQAWSQSQSLSLDERVFSWIGKLIALLSRGTVVLLNKSEAQDQITSCVCISNDRRPHEQEHPWKAHEIFCLGLAVLNLGVKGPFRRGHLGPSAYHLHFTRLIMIHNSSNEMILRLEVSTTGVTMKGSQYGEGWGTGESKILCSSLCKLILSLSHFLSSTFPVKVGMTP